MSVSTYVTESGMKVSAVEELDFRPVELDFDKHTVDERALLVPGLIIGCRLKFVTHLHEGDRTHTLSLRGEYTDDMTDIEAPRTKYNPSRNLRTMAAPLFRIAISTDGLPLTEVGIHAVGYVRWGESPLIPGLDGNDIAEVLGIPGELHQLRPHLSLVERGSLYTMTPVAEDVA